MQHCPICQHVGYKRVANTKYVSCLECVHYYQKEYVPKVFDVNHTQSSEIMSDHEKAVNAGLADWLVQRTGLGQGAKVADVGAKYPYMMAYLQNTYGMSAMAIDGIPEVEGFGKELGVKTWLADYEEVVSNGLPKDRFFKDLNLVVMVHSIEHFYDPRIIIQDISRALGPEGYLYIRCPLNDVSGIEREFTESHYQIHPNIFCKKSLILAAKAADLTLLEVHELQGAGQGDFLFQKLGPDIPKFKLGVGMIVKNEEHDLPECLDSIKEIASAIVLVDTGSTDNTAGVVREFCDKNKWLLKERVPELTDVGTKILFYSSYHGASIQDSSGDWKLQSFSKARNRYVELLEPVSEWILWMDADDVMLQPERVPYLFDGHIDAYTFGIVDNRDHPTGRFMHHRLWKASTKARYKGACHEYPDFGGRNVSMEFSGVDILHKYDVRTGQELSTNRNLRILATEYEAGVRDFRTLFYLANSYRDCGKYDDAIKIYDEYLSKDSGFHNERVCAAMYRARCYRFKGDLKTSIKKCYEALALDDSISETWMEIAYCYGALGDWENVEKACLSALRQPPQSYLFQELNKYTDQPWRHLSIAYQNRGDLIKAAKATKKVLEIVPGDSDMIQRLKSLTSIHVCRPGAIGDVIMIMNSLPKLKEKYPDKSIIFYTSDQCRDVVSLMDCVSEVRPHTEYQDGMGFNLMGYPRDKGYPDVPLKKHLVEYFAAELGVTPDLDSLWIPHLETRVDLSKFELPLKYVTLHVAAGWSPYKNWFPERWQMVVDHLVQRDVTVIQIGNAGEPLIERTIDLRGKTTIPEALAILLRSRFHMGGDSFTNHATNIKRANGEKTRALILWGSTSPIGSGYSHNFNVWKAYRCGPCYKEYKELSIDYRGECNHTTQGLHSCMDSILPFEVIKILECYFI